MVTIFCSATNINDSVCDSPDSVLVNFDSAAICKIKKLSKLLHEHDAERVVVEVGHAVWCYDLFQDLPADVEVEVLLNDLAELTSLAGDHEQPTQCERVHVYKDKFRLTCIEKHSEDAFEIRTPLISLGVLDMPAGSLFTNIN
ncbi:hypothetical protein GCM10011607_12060 [Shewanella inventionis]|uniref:Uncharacterized protein n=1 Tax=Shewanella inventionis TaxID=1738770 RepID=A0ABQ1IUY5_9GAMM|nr:hypothetical protein [Shewanella inventionis]GGB53137.1 hypothetical protein GCM10011607_12060 [Shewanella inventionis]